MDASMVHRNAYFPSGIMNDPPAIFMNSDFKDSREKKGKTIAVKNDLHNKSISVILADDDADDRNLFKEAIEEAAFNVNVEFAEDGQCLLDILKNGKALPDLIFLDLNMPNMTGKECLDEIRKNERLKNIPVIIYSTSSSMKDIEETFEKGANLYVKKPSSFKELTIITMKVLSLDWNKYTPHASRNQFLFSSKTE